MATAQLFQTAAGTAFYTLDDSGNLTITGTLTAAALAISSGGVLSVDPGTVAAPGAAFVGDLDTGLYRIGANNWGIAAGGAACLSGSTTAVTASLPFIVPAGSTSAASLQSSGDANTGLYFPAADTLGLVAGGVEYLRITYDAALPTLRIGGTGPVPLVRNDGAGSSTVAGGGTLSQAQHRAGHYYQDASGGSVTCTTRTAAQLVADFPGVAAGHVVLLYGSSNHASNTSTISGGSNVTLVGSGAITQTGGLFRLLFTNVGSGTEAVTMHRVG